MMVLKSLFHISKRLSLKIIKILHTDSKLSHKNSTLKSKMNPSTKYRQDPVIMKLNSPEFQKIFTPELETLTNLFQKYGYDIRIAGGAVRDLLMGTEPKDLDFATTATPEEMKEIFTKEEIRMINMNGEKHGTITPRINDNMNFEVTTLRVDIVTDGRHAEVQFTRDWLLDANRRDLTINSMFLGLDGSVYDYFYGYEDLQKKRVAFVGDPDERIKEDYLRILRYFRFYGRIADRPDNHEDSTLHTISENVNGLQKISGERIWTEFRKILEGNFAGQLLKTMLHVGIHKHIGLPDKPNETELDALLKRTTEVKINPITMLVSLLNSVEDVANMHARLKVSAFERDLAFFIVEHREDKPHVKPLLPYQQLILSSKYKSTHIKDYVLEVLKYRGDLEKLKQIQEWKMPRFPIDGYTLSAAGVKGGKFMGLLMSKLKLIWAENDFVMTKEDLMKYVPEILDELNEKKKSKQK